MKIGLDFGHGVSYDGGAVGIRKEEDCINPVGRVVVSKLIQLGHEVVELRPSSASSLSDSLEKRCYTANMAHVDLVVSIHFNIGGGHGTEVYAVSDKGREYAIKVLNEIVSLGYTNRGVKSANFYILKNTIAPAILIEGSFLDSEEDMSRYNAEAYANAIVKAITGQTVQEVKPVVKKPYPGYLIKYNPLKCDENVKYLQKALGGIIVDGYFGNITLEAVKKFQRANGLGVDGIVGINTWGRL